MKKAERDKKIRDLEQEREKIFNKRMSFQEWCRSMDRLAEISRDILMLKDGK